jgi:hypothetical protein
VQGPQREIAVWPFRSGDPKPSLEDIEMTREIKAAAGALGISITWRSAAKARRASGAWDYCDTLS